ncbi:unnamed protein product, partial [Amoebophrya sp. A25]
LSVNAEKLSDNVDSERRLIEEDMREMLHQTLIWWETLRKRIMRKESENDSILRREVKRMQAELGHDDGSAHEERFRDEYGTYLRERSGVLDDLEQMLSLCTVYEAKQIRKDARLVRHKTHLLEILVDALEEMREIRRLYWNLEHFSLLPQFWKKSNARVMRGEGEVASWESNGGQMARDTVAMENVGSSVFTAEGGNGNFQSKSRSFNKPYHNLVTGSLAAAKMAIGGSQPGTSLGQKTRVHSTDHFVTAGQELADRLRNELHQSMTDVQFDPETG